MPGNVTITRRCDCGETLADYKGKHTPEGLMVFECRNCRKPYVYRGRRWSNQKPKANPWLDADTPKEHGRATIHVARQAGDHVRFTRRFLVDTVKKLTNASITFQIGAGSWGEEPSTAVVLLNMDWLFLNDQGEKERVPALKWPAFTKAAKIVARKLCQALMQDAVVLELQSAKGHYASQLFTNYARSRQDRAHLRAERLVAGQAGRTLEGAKVNPAATINITRRGKRVGGWVYDLTPDMKDAVPRGTKYIVSCEDHGTFVGSRSKADAFLVARNRENFCDACRGQEAAPHARDGS